MTTSQRGYGGNPRSLCHRRQVFLRGHAIPKTRRRARYRLLRLARERLLRLPRLPRFRRMLRLQTCAHALGIVACWSAPSVGTPSAGEGFLGASAVVCGHHRAPFVLCACASWTGARGRAMRLQGEAGSALLRPTPSCRRCPQTNTATCMASTPSGRVGPSHCAFAPNCLMYGGSYGRKIAGRGKNTRQCLEAVESLGSLCRKRSLPYSWWHTRSCSEGGIHNPLPPDSSSC